ncbi:MAG TPA: histidinol phosphate phosphatase domain-containing protein [Spirochaetota bacterium]|nr:histidinol phosphate phosphatase domain-containing protein [Spirochaetota bacterium]HOM38029.1 histidinol phosphate phosphatase domain-containing protein [Spirochaetota bacterium]HPQ48833.1 histidinol phosphate phosphatase domain-containing protein [Spirochaetota bacterium]
MERRIIDLHNHTFFSDGELIPNELVQSARFKGYSVVGISDHVDFTNYDEILNKLLGAKEFLNSYDDINVFIGVEITHVKPSLIEKLVYKIREKGAEYVIVHGETIIEPVEKGTNRAAIDSCVDILAHPGFISDEDVKLASKNNVFLELTKRKGHSLTNGHVARLAQKYSAPLIVGSDSHTYSDIYSSFEEYKSIFLGSGLDDKEFDFYYKKVMGKIESIKIL